MAWERRARGGTSNTRSRRVGGRVVRESLGAGPAAQLAARLDAEARRRRAEVAAAIRAEALRLTEADAPADRLDAAAAALLEATLLASGFHRPARTGWRRRRSHG